MQCIVISQNTDNIKSSQINILSIICIENTIQQAHKKIVKVLFAQK